MFAISSTNIWTTRMGNIIRTTVKQRLGTPYAPISHQELTRYVFFLAGVLDASLALMVLLEFKVEQYSNPIVFELEDSTDLSIETASQLEHVDYTPVTGMFLKPFKTFSSEHTSMMLLVSVNHIVGKWNRDLKHWPTIA